MAQCLFCEIAAGNIPAETVYSDENLIAFRDIDPQAPTHLLVIPRLHLDGLHVLTQEHEALLGKLLTTAAEIARAEGLQEDGYRFVINCGEQGGQTVGHLHLHLLGGRSLTWPPG